MRRTAANLAVVALVAFANGFAGALWVQAHAPPAAAQAPTWE